MKKTNLFFWGIAAVLSLALCFGRSASPAFAEGTSSSVTENAVYCKVVATVNWSTVTVSVFPTDGNLSNSNIVPMPAWYTFSSQAIASIPTNTVIIPLTNGQGNATITIPGLYTVGSSLVAPDGSLIKRLDTRFTINNPTPVNYIDVAMQRELTSSSQNIYKYKVTVWNNGNNAVNNFTVKDYIPSNAVVTYAPGGVLNQWVITWAVNTLAAGQSKTFFIEFKRIKEGVLKTKWEVCNYEGMNSLVTPHDIDSTACNMWVNGTVTQDDEAAHTTN